MRTDIKLVTVVCDRLTVLAFAFGFSSLRRQFHNDSSCMLLADYLGQQGYLFAEGQLCM